MRDSSAVTIVGIFSHCDSFGGAARAAYRLHRALISGGQNSRMVVRKKLTDDSTVNGPADFQHESLNLVRTRLGRMLGACSVNILPSNWSSRIESMDIDIVNLHWVGYETMSVEDIGRIKKPIVWTIHDMWPFCGSKHYDSEDCSAGWRKSYTSTKDFPNFNVDRFVWRRKRRAWNRPMQIIAPSRWLATCARESTLFRDWPIHVVPYVVDTDIYKPLDRTFCRQALGLPLDKRILLYGAVGGSRDYRKGYDLMLDALNVLARRTNFNKWMSVGFGQGGGQSMLPFSSRWMGYVHDDVALVLMYNAADVLILPSRKENLPQTAMEAQACGCPVVAFSVGGTCDVIVHGQTGYLAKPYDTEDLAEGLQIILEESEYRSRLSRAAREQAVNLWSPEVVVRQYLKVYANAMNRAYSSAGDPLHATVHTPLN
jgi:glycosyltransferase involved in cell wall biosynthesis